MSNTPSVVGGYVNMVPGRCIVAPSGRLRVWQVLAGLGPRQGRWLKPGARRVVRWFGGLG